MQVIEILFFLAGLALLVGGAELLVRGASHIAQRFRISPLVIGLTIVALGSSAPEVAVSIYAALENKPNVAIGNVVGSNVFNTLFVLGAAAAVTPLFVARKLIRLDTPLMVVASIVVLVLAADGYLGLFDAFVLCLLLGVYLLFNLRSARAEGPEEPQTGHTALSIFLVTAGIAALVLGSNLLVDSATAIARVLGLSELVIGLTVVAVGTGLPEAATTIVAALRGERDMAVANVVGSNTLNLLFVLGIASFSSGAGIEVAPAAIRFDLPVMVASALVCLPIFFSRGRITRWEGVLLLGFYLAYLAYVVLDATGHDAIGPYSAIMLAFVLPLSAIAIILPVVQHWRSPGFNQRAADGQTS